MNGVSALSDEVRQAVERSFSESEHDAVFEALATMRPADHEGLLFQAFGDLARLNILVKYYDWRDFSDWLEKTKDEEIIRRRERLGLSLPTHAEKRKMREKQFEEEVIGFIARSIDFPRNDLAMSTQLQRDLGINGSAGAQFIRSFAEQFKVDLRNFNIADYFESNLGEHPVSDFIKQLLGRGGQSQKLPITIESLIQAAVKQAWMETERSHEE